VKGLFKKNTGPSGKRSFLELFKGKITESDEETEKEKLVERMHFKSRIFQKLRKPLDLQKLDPDPAKALDPENIDHSQADARWMPRLSGDAGNATIPVSDAVDKMTSTIVQVI